MMHGGDADGCGVERAGAGEAGFDGGEGGDGEVFCGFGGGGWVAVDDSGELDGMTGVFELTKDAEVVASEGSGSDDGDAEWMGGGHYFFSTASRQRA
jgi:hypothetical protein